MNRRIRNVLSWWLLQVLAVWVVINVFTVIPYIYFVRRNGNYMFHEDKSPVTAWEYFVQENYRFDTFVVLLFLLLVEVNYQYLFKKFGWLLFAGSCFAISIFMMIIVAARHPHMLKVWGVLSAVRPVILAAAYAFSYAIIREYLYQLKYKKEVQLQQSQSELSSLKAQLNPHFLFNSLNYLYGTALNEQALQTADGIDRLSEMLRYTVTGMHENFVPLENEIAFIQNYVAIQKARLLEKDTINLELLQYSSFHEFEIAPMLLLTFIESAFKHGISTEQHCYVHIKIELTGNCLVMETRNRIFPRQAGTKNSNTGVQTMLKRLQLLYPDSYKLESTQSADEYKTLLTLHLNACINDVNL